MPALELVNKPMNNHINDFYGNGSLFVPNKFMVGFYGPYVNEAMAELERECENKDYGVGAYKSAFEVFKTNHFMVKDKIFELKWMCNTISLPTPTPVVESNFNIDTTKGIKYPLIKGYASGPAEIQLNLVENRRLQGFQFFNALMNRFFVPELMRAKSSFHKLNMYVAVLNFDETNVGGGRDMERYGYSTNSRTKEAIDDIPLQVFEYNSVILTSIGKVALENSAKPNVLNYTITLAAPDPFQGSYNTTFKGLRDNTSGKLLSNTTVTTGLALKDFKVDGVKVTAYIPSFFEEPEGQTQKLIETKVTDKNSTKIGTSTSKGGAYGGGQRSVLDANAYGVDGAESRASKNNYEFNMTKKNTLVPIETSNTPPKINTNPSEPSKIGNGLGTGRAPFLP